ncbi:SDR family NAD(P)-dependent oxidoreductase [Nocardioides alcanivorans]|uniref:SDR family NAD(P)-dependent oxidoreductase n=1 Tax=Nocardioides alcanivorans TaxID=2897352 RepID=UPI001F1DF4AB|nr:glucose 1-dehydrogenase [Nocardioides alcanivorans]
MTELENRVALVTGAAAGMGEATAHALARAGATVVVSDVQEQAGEAVVAAIREAGGKASFFRADVSREEDVAALVTTTVERHGSLDCAVNNAAVRPDTRPLVDLDIDAFDRVIAVDLRGVALCLKYELRQMQAQERGSIVNIGSVSSQRPRPSNPGYVAAKHGVVGLTKVAAIEHGKDGIRINAVLPGGVDTPMIREARAASGIVPSDEFALSLFGRLGTPDEIAEASLWLCSDRSSYVTGHSLAVDAGYLAR